MSLSPKFGSLDLTRTNGIAVGKFNDKAAMKVKMSTGFNDANFADIRDEGRQIEMALAVTGSSESDFRTKLDALLALVDSDSPQILRISNDRQIVAYPEISSIKYQPHLGSIKLARLNVKFKAADCYWRATTQSSATLPSSVTGQTTGVLPFTSEVNEIPDWEIKNETDEIETGSVAMAVMSGAYPRSEWRLDDVTWGVNDTLVISARTGLVYWKAGATASAQSPKRISGRWWDIEPGINNIRYKYTGLTTGMNATIQYYSRYAHLGDIG